MFLVHVMTHMINSGLMTLRTTIVGTTPLGVKYLRVYISYFRTEKFSWMRSEMSSMTENLHFLGFIIMFV